jgi:peptide deformylase
VKLVSPSDPILTQECQEFDFTNPPFDATAFAKELVEFMYSKNGIGLAANQVGVPYRIFAMKGSPLNIVCFNPRVVMPSSEEIVLEEGCLSHTNLFVKIKRPQHVRVRFETPNGVTETMQYTGMTARIFQHELEHLNGGVFFKRAKTFHLRQALNRKKIMDRRQKAA